MKRFIVITLALMLSMATIAVAQEPAPLYGVMAGSFIGVNDFTQTAYGMQIGGIISVDAGKGLSLRVLRTKSQWGKLDFRAVSIAPMMSWYAGRKWDFYVMVGGENWQIGDESGQNYFAGFGTNRRLYTAGGEEWLVPLTIDAFLDFTTDDKGASFENATQITFGFRFSKPIKK